MCLHHEGEGGCLSDCSPKLDRKGEYAKLLSAKALNRKVNTLICCLRNPQRWIMGRHHEGEGGLPKMSLAKAAKRKKKKKYVAQTILSISMPD